MVGRAGGDFDRALARRAAEGAAVAMSAPQRSGRASGLARWRRHDQDDSPSPLRPARLRAAGDAGDCGAGGSGGGDARHDHAPRRRGRGAGAGAHARHRGAGVPERARGDAPGRRRAGCPAWPARAGASGTHVVARTRSGAGRVERRAGRLPGRERQSARDTDEPAARRPRARARAAGAGGGVPAGGRQAGAAGARAVHERSAMEPRRARPRRGARPGAGLRLPLPALQQRPSHLHQRARAGRPARGSARAMAASGRGAGDRRPQHGRAGGAQRLPLRPRKRGRPGRAGCAGSLSSARLTWARPWNAPATGST